MNIKNNQGFTLLEVLIAITILSLLMVSIYSIVENSTMTKERVISEDRDKMQLELAFSRLETDIEFIVSPLYFESSFKDDERFYIKAYRKTRSGSSQEDDSIYDEKKTKYDNLEHYESISESYTPIAKIINDGKSTLTFLSSSNRRLIKDSKQQAHQWVKYELVTTQGDDVNKEAPNTLMRSTINENLYVSQIDWSSIKSHPVLDNIQELAFSFWDEKREKFVDSIKEMTTNKLTPRLIKVKLKYKSPSGETYDGERTFRPLWLKIDTRKALEDKYKFKATGPSGGIVGGAGGEVDESINQTIPGEDDE